MSDAAAPRFDVLRVLRGTGHTLWRQRRPLIAAGLLAGFLPAFLLSQGALAVSILTADFLHPDPTSSDPSPQWWLWWAIRNLLWVAEGVLATAPIVWLTLNDQRGRPVTLAALRDALLKAFWPLWTIGLIFDVRHWGQPVAFLIPLTNAWLAADVLLRLALLLLVAWFGIAVSVIIEEGGGVRRALARSAWLLKGRRLIYAGIECALLIALEASWKPIHALADLLGVVDPILHTALSYLLFQVPWVLIAVFETMLYVEMRRLRDPFPEAGA